MFDFRSAFYMKVVCATIWIRIGFLNLDNLCEVSFTCIVKADIEIFLFKSLFYWQTTHQNIQLCRIRYFFVERCTKLTQNTWFAHFLNIFSTWTQSCLKFQIFLYNMLQSHLVHVLIFSVRKVGKTIESQKDFSVCFRNS